MLQNIDVLFEGGKVVEIVRYYSSKVWWQLWQESVLLVCTRRRDSTRQSQQGIFDQAPYRIRKQSVFTAALEFGEVAQLSTRRRLDFVLASGALKLALTRTVNFSSSYSVQIVWQRLSSANFE